MSYRRTRYPDESLMEDVYNKLHRLGRYASRQELLDEIRDLNLELEREKNLIQTYRSRYEDKQKQSTDLTKNLDTVREYQSSLLREHKDLEDRYAKLKSLSEGQKQDIALLKKELDTKDYSYYLTRRRYDDRWWRELELEKSLGSKYRYWHWRPWLYKNHRDLYDKYYPYTSYDPSWYYNYYDRYYWDYDDYGLRRKLALEDRMSAIQRMTDDLKLTNSRMLKDLKTVRSALDH